MVKVYNQNNKLVFRSVSRDLVSALEAYNWGRENDWQAKKVTDFTEKFPQQTGYLVYVNGVKIGGDNGW